MNVFRDHGKIYEMSASKISGVPFKEILEHKRRTGEHHELRKKIGKISELASGYGGWVGAWKAFGADKFMGDDEIKRNILKWREESPMIEEFWGGQVRKTPGRWEFKHEYYGVEGMAICAVLEPGRVFSYRCITFQVHGDVLYIGLPSGRYLSYHKPRLTVAYDRRAKDMQIYNLSYMGISDTPKQWVRLDTYGGKLVENITQAVARDILKHAMLQLNKAGYAIVLHVHDEITVEVPEGWGSIEEVEKIMSTMPQWCADWPVKAKGGWRGKRFRK
jgi:DNA polymerase